MDRMQNIFQQVTAGQKVTPRCKRLLTKAGPKSSRSFRKRWAENGAHVSPHYRNSLSQSEVDGMIAFYQTPAGQAVISKRR
ncbi:MAG: DUF2059 domain-containing protein [Chthoniobacterales bacterium]